MANRSLGILQPLGWLLLGLSLALLVVSVVVPQDILISFSREFLVFGQLLRWLETSTSVDLTHIILFGWVGFLFSSMRWNSPWWQPALALIGLALATELVQFLVPGRTPQVSDLYDDVFGIVSGVVLAIPLRWFVRLRKSP